jgi:hypothetical protein
MSYAILTKETFARRLGKIQNGDNFLTSQRNHNIIPLVKVSKKSCDFAIFSRKVFRKSLSTPDESNCFFKNYDL